MCLLRNGFDRIRLISGDEFAKNVKNCDFRTICLYRLDVLGDGRRNTIIGHRNASVSRCALEWFRSNYLLSKLIRAVSGISGSRVSDYRFGYPNLYFDSVPRNVALWETMKPDVFSLNYYMLTD